MAVGGHMSSSVARRILSSIAVAAVAAAALTACVPPGEKAHGTVVGPAGFTITVGGVTATGSAGVAPAGTEVRLEVISAPIPEEVGQFASVWGDAVNLTLGGGLQPAAPIQLSFRVPEGNQDGLYVLGRDDTTGTGVAFVDSVADASSSTVVATVEHLSWYTPVKVSQKRFGEKLGDWINQALGNRSAAPSCFGANTDLVFSAVKDEIVWPCTKKVGTAVDWSLQSNSGLVWQVLTDPKAEYQPHTVLSAAGIATAAIANRIQPSLEGDTVITPLETLNARLANSSSATIALQVEPGLSQVATIMFGLSMIVPSKWLAVITNAECLVGVIETATSAPSGESVRSILSCVATNITGVGGVLLGIALAGPGLLASQLEGIVREIKGTNVVQFTLGRPDKNEVLPDSAAFESELQSVTAPPACTRPAGKLVNGTLPIEDSGGNYAGFTGLAQKAKGEFLYAINPSSTGPASAVVFTCSAGGVGWPDVVGFYDRDLKLLGYLDMGELNYQQEHSTIDTLQFRGGSLYATWWAYEGAGFGKCDPTTPDKMSGLLTLQPDGTVVASDVVAPC